MPESLKGIWSIGDVKGGGGGNGGQGLFIAPQEWRENIHKANSSSWGAPVVGIERQDSSP